MVGNHRGKMVGHQRRNHWAGKLKDHTLLRRRSQDRGRRQKTVMYRHDQDRCGRVRRQRRRLVNDLRWRDIEIELFLPIRTTGCHDHHVVGLNVVQLLLLLFLLAFRTSFVAISRVPADGRGLKGQYTLSMREQAHAHLRNVDLCIATVRRHIHKEAEHVFVTLISDQNGGSLRQSADTVDFFLPWRR